MSQEKPILKIENFRLADVVRALPHARLPGSCSTLLNTAPKLSGGSERVRRGYAAYTDVTAPTGAQILKVAPIQNPSQEDVHLWFASNSGQKLYMNPWWKPGGSKQSTNLLLSESIPSFVWAGSVGTSTITITGADTLMGLTADQKTTDWFKNWAVKNVTQTEYVLVLSNTYSAAAGGTIVLTTSQKVDAFGLNWIVGENLALARNFHDDFSFLPSYNTTLADPPDVPIPIDSILRLSGGQSSAPGNVGIRIDPYINRTFFPGISGGVVFTGTYASKRKCAALSKTDIFGHIGSPVGAVRVLQNNHTYWLAAAAVYDGFQIGELTKFESITDYDQVNTDWTFNYLKSTAVTGGIVGPDIRITLGSLNKRITGFIIYMAQDPGDTHLTGRVNPYFALKHIPIDSTEGLGASWVLTQGGGEGYYQLIWSIGGNEWDARGNTYTVDAGYVEIPTDTMYSYSGEFISGLRHYLHNLYIGSTGAVDRQNLFTNPIGGNPDINSGVIQPDIFSNEEEIFRLRTEPTVGTKLMGLRSIGIQEILVVKDRGTLIAREITSPLGTPSLIWQIISPDRGSASLEQIAVGDNGDMYFAGYDDIHRYRQGVLENLIEDAKTQNDWLNTYREAISKASKESTAVWWLPERIVYFDIAQTSGQQYAFYIDHGWREVRFKVVATVATQFFKWITRLQSGMVVGTTNDATAEFKKFSNPASNTYYYADGGTNIPYKIDTGDFIPSGERSIDTILNYFTIARSFDSPSQGTLDIDLYKDGAFLRTYADQNKANPMLRIQSKVDDPRIANSWRLRINSNASPEVLNAGTILGTDHIYLFGEFRARGKRANESVTGNTGSVLGDGVSNTIGGKQEVIVNSTDTTFSWDIAFTKSYTGNEGAGIPTYRFEMEPAYVLSGDKGTPENVVIISKSLTQITLRSTSDNTLVKFKATE